MGAPKYYLAMALYALYTFGLLFALFGTAVVGMLFVEKGFVTEFVTLVGLGAFSWYGLKKLGENTKELLVFDPVLIGNVDRIIAPGGYDYKILVAKRSSGNRYIVLFRPAGSVGFTFTKEAFTVNGYRYSSDLQDELMDVAARNIEAANAVITMIERQGREAKSDGSIWEYRIKKVTEVAEVIKS